MVYVQSLYTFHSVGINNVLCYWRNPLRIMQMTTCCIAMTLPALVAHSFNYKQNPQFNDI